MERRKKKQFQELEFSDAFMFAATMEDTELCRRVLERILEIPIKKVTVHTENRLAFNPDYRSVRLDVYVDDEDGTMYDVEMETARKRKQMPKRVRLYQGQMDVAAMPPGADFIQLPESYVIFICTFDPFGDGLFRYTFENLCLENGRRLGDDAHKIFLNTKGKNGDMVSPELIQFLKFVENSASAKDVGDPLLHQLLDRIRVLKQDRRLERSYMLFSEIISDERQDARQEGFEEGRAEMAHNISTLLAVIKPEDLAELQKHPDSLQEMLENYHIINR